ncbi:hypothetical protein U5922_007560 [Aquicoccus sp. G2-2]|uniref:hypothetical protein n=1 Tax=Aquicoccus sp. G2-2 TaxID=3092120 RepID=UPI002ADF3DEB|nr:hypothetical protein [Aquicoccus sp. G2-2]MEA1113340.1 hypothetical protein [Aquicoccus sp. G2-2]
MTWDPRLTLMRPELSRDLGRVMAWCEHKHPDLPGYTLVAAVKFFEALGIAMEVGVAEIKHPFDDVSVIRTAVGAIGILGYFTSAAGAKWTSPGIAVFAADLAAHDRIAAVRHFHDMGL